MKYIPRAIESTLESAFAEMPAVFLNGPRQSGKSTLVRHLAGTRFRADYVTFDDMTAFAAASADPEGFLRGFREPVILDEVQRVPGCFRALKMLIDEQRADFGSASARGRFLLTGSANIMAFPELAEALVGRMGVLSLLPLSASETVGHGVPVIRGWFDQAVGGGTANVGQDLATVIRRATFPEISGARPASAAIWLDGYIATLLQREIRQLADIEKLPALPDLVKLLAARAGGLLNDAGCARDVRLNPMTFRRYRTLIDQLFLTMLVPPWHRNIGKRLVKSPKLYFTDTLLLCHQLGVDIESLPGRNPVLYGQVVENFVASELARQLALIPDCRLFHFRTHDDREVDFVIERRDGRLLGIEVKTRAHAETRDFDGLRLLQEKTGKDFARGILLHTGTATIPFGDNMFAMPLGSLWSFDMDARMEKDVRWSSNLEAYIFWSNYGERTRIRCHILPESIGARMFHGGVAQSAALHLIRARWEEISAAIKRKILAGEIETVDHDNGDEIISEQRFQKIKQVTLGPSDIRLFDN